MSLSSTLHAPSISRNETSIITIIIIILDLQYAPMLSVSVVKYEADNVTVNVEWDRQVDVTYTLCVSPLAPVVVTGSTGRQLTISYNTEYNVTVEASTPCRPNDKAFIVLNYGKVYSNSYYSYSYITHDNINDVYTHRELWRSGVVVDSNQSFCPKDCGT